MRGFILTPTYRVRGGVPEVRLHGVLENGGPFLVIDDRARPYFFVRAADRPRVDAVIPGLGIDDSELRTFGGEPVGRITLTAPGDVPALRTRLEAAGIECLEADLRFASRYLIDRGIRGALQIDGHGEPRGRLGLVFRNPVLSPCHWTPTLKVLSIDIETDPRADHVLSIALHTQGLSRVLIVHQHVFPHAEPVHSERVLLQRFLAYLDELDPDVITGWNVAEFDLAVLARRARHYGLPFPIGRTEDAFELRRELGYTRTSRAITHGRLVLDGLALLHGAFIRLPDYRLETAAQTLLGRGKLITGHQRADAILRAYQDDTERFVAYNLEDARLVSDILAHTGLIELAVERSLLTGMPLDRVSAAIASVDALYLGALRGRGRVAPSVGGSAGDVRLTGGYVMDSIPGLYRNVLVFDFKSLYPSIIRTFNLDPLELLPADDDRDAIVAPNGARFRRDERGILPELVEHLGAARERARAEGRTVKSHAIKILMNSLYGVLGAGASRLFSPAVSNAITHFGQLLIRTAADFAAAQGYRVIYGDTDSLFVHAGEADADAALAGAEALRIAIGEAVAGVVRERFGCESFLDLEFEKLYLRFFLPEVRSGKTGSKKRYAGLLRAADGREHIEFVGLESVRRDWSEVSKRFQLGLLERIFADQPVDAFVREFVADLRAGRHDDALTYRKAVRKELDAYTKTTPPHVRAARLLGEQAGRIVAYTMTHNGAEPVGEETAGPDYAHYVEHQLKPVGDAILRFLGTDFDTLTGAQRQLALF
ncbi:MAG TPA: DNA polymerase II [Candidatus Dormibacteraeota bacterium]|nr:DNA polymerase II [Candidatus Dormibacteraeota bacterium]